MPRKARRKPAPRKTYRPKSFMHRLKQSVGWPWFRKYQTSTLIRTGLVVAFWAAVLLIVSILILSVGLPDIRKAVVMEHRPTVIMRDKNDKEFARSGDSQGAILTLQQMSPWMPKAVMAIEDRRFYSHWGVDPYGLVRAMWTNIRAGGVSQGGSTITQQLAKNLFLSPERTFTRKIKEALLALYLERRYTKDEILAAYLNRAYFGAGAYGVESAARVYFNVSAHDLNVQQAAMLAGLLKAPTHYSPDNDPKLTMQRTHTVIVAMVAAGYLKPGSENMKIAALPKREYNVSGGSDMRYYADWIMSQVDSYTGNNSQDLVIDTTLDTGIQSYATKDLRNVVDKDGPRLNVSQGALITMRTDGAVVAMIGGKDYTASQYNRAVIATRQPGSSFKLFVYLTALENGYTPQSQVLDAPISVGSYAPTNYDGKYHGTITLQDAVANSLNTVAVRTLKDVGISKVKNLAQRLGITEDLTSDLSLALGASDVHILSMTTAYASVANNGHAVQPYGIRRISTPDGEVLYERRDVESAPVLTGNVVAEMNQMLQAVIFYGTGKAAAIDRPAAGKTGTTSNFRDAWFIGYTNDYVTSVWVGNDDGASMKHVTGGTLPARIWHDVMLKAENGLPIRPLSSAVSANSSATISGETSAPVVPPVPVTPNLPPQPATGTTFDNLISNILGGDNPEPATQPAPVNEDPTHQPAPVTQGTNFAPPPSNVQPTQPVIPSTVPVVPQPAIQWDQSPGAVQPLQLPAGH
jgi:penicillin-binding protein 1A